VTKRGALIVLDAAMLLSFTVLMSWRFSGVAAHEWIGLALIALILTHLVVHWGWVESSVARIMTARRRRFVPLLLNVALFLSMGTALVSGIVISKVAFPNTLSPGNYLHWHSLHEISATLTLFILGLHVALNWDRIRTGCRHLVETSRRRSGRIPRPRQLPTIDLVRRVAWVLGLCAVLAGGVWIAARAVPTHAEVLMTFPDGHRELVAPPADIARLQPGSTVPNPSRGGPKFFMIVTTLLVAAVIGRKVLRLRLSSV